MINLQYLLIQDNKVIRRFWKLALESILIVIAINSDCAADEIFFISIVYFIL